MLLSIIIPVYNAGERVKKCLESIGRLEEKNLEIIVINDGSTDNTAEYFKEFQDRDNRFQFIEKVNSGVSDTRNYGLSIAKGKYVAFVDADDTITEGYNQIIEVIKRNECDLYGFNLTISMNGNESILEKVYLKKGINNQEILLKEFFAGRSNSVCTHIYKTEIINREKLAFESKVKMGEDLLFNARYFQLANGIYFFDMAPYVYDVGNTGSAVHIQKLSYLEDYMKIYDELVNLRTRYGGMEIRKSEYLQQVYQVLKYHGRTLEKQYEERFRNSILFKEIIGEQYNGKWKLQVKRLLLKARAYKIFLP